MNALPLTSGQATALARLRAALGESRFVLIGAAALGYHVPLPRATADIDLAMIVEPADFEGLLTPLGWRRNPRILQRWYTADDVVADILPATDSLIALGELRFDNDSKAMSLVGFDLAVVHAIAVELPGSNTTIEVASLPALVVLKMVSWLDRPLERVKDLADIAHVLDHALPDDDERRWDPNLPLIGAGLDHDEQAAYFVGWQVGAIMQPRHRERVEAFFECVSDRDSVAFAQMVRAPRFGRDEAEEKLLRQLRAFRQGLEAQ